MIEIWKDIKGFEGLYQVSNLGRVKSVDRFRKVNGGTRLQKGCLLKNSPMPFLLLWDVHICRLGIVVRNVRRTQSYGRLAADDVARTLASLSPYRAPVMPCERLDMIDVWLSFPIVAIENQRASVSREMRTAARDDVA